MEYVKVPVPEELVGEVTQYMQWNMRKPEMGGLDVDAAVDLLDSLDDPVRRLVLHAAECAVEVVPLAIPDAATVTGLSEHEVLGYGLEFNDAVRRAGGPPIALATGRLHGSTENGPKAWTLSMPVSLAEYLLNVAGRGVVDPDDATGVEKLDSGADDAPVDFGSVDQRN